MVDYDRYAVGRTIRAIRKEKGLSQEVVSGFAVPARSHLAMIENGQKKANFETLWKIALAFDMEPHELVRRIEQEILKGKESEKNSDFSEKRC